MEGISAILHLELFLQWSHEAHIRFTRELCWAYIGFEFWKHRDDSHRVHDSKPSSTDLGAAGRTQWLNSMDGGMTSEARWKWALGKVSSSSRHWSPSDRCRSVDLEKNASWLQVSNLLCWYAGTDKEGIVNGVQEDPSVDTLPVCHKQVKRGLMLSSKLDTLRDMTLDTHIEPSSLTKVKDLGGGAFATGDRTWAYWDWMCSFVLLLNAGLTDVDLIYYSDTKQALSLFYCASLLSPAKLVDSDRHADSWLCFLAVELCKYTPPTGGETLVAVKRLRPSIIKNKEELHNFVEETKLLRKLQHRCRTLLTPFINGCMHPI